MARYSHLLLILGIHFIFISSQVCNDSLVPVILVPGLGGSQLEAQLNKPTVKHSFCNSITNRFFNLWLDVKQLLPVVIDCWIDNIRLNYDDFSNHTYNQPGVKIRVSDFGNPKVVEYLDSKSWFPVEGYLNVLTKAIVDLGYTRSKNLYAAPYDFRKGPSELGNWFEELEELIENAYRNNTSSVILIGHSMGGLLIHKFLINKSQIWKDKYIKAFISLSTPFGGSMKALKVFASGDDLGVFLLRPAILREVLSTMPSMAYLLPVKKIWGDEILVTTNEKNYTLDDLEQFFIDIGNPTGWKMYLNEREYATELGPPGVEVRCFYGEGSATIKRLIYGSNGFRRSPLLEFEDGDGTASLRSLEYCKKWITQQKERVQTKVFDEIDHMGVIQDNLALESIVRAVRELSNCE
ncbi:unnamed protein product [Nezara viridula]|uniref:Uncharacterized protein n=1 Tax=Nezara viridula TaxID=85310 RepID=A0A9P0HDZ6_NEZVI|nr:unnamed protein product [Nezara viridula]